MKVVRDRRDARWLPSRFHFALFRLLAYSRLRFAAPEREPGVVMAIQKDQSAIEAFLVALSVLIVLTSFAASLLAVHLSPAAAWAIAIPATGAFILIGAVIAAAVFTPILRRLTGLSSEKSIAVNSAILMLMVIAAATLMATGDSPVRYVGIGFLSLVAVNALASVAVLAMDGRFAEAEERFGVEP